MEPIEGLKIQTPIRPTIKTGLHVNSHEYDNPNIMDP
jgi:hypothetical protein